MFRFSDLPSSIPIFPLSGALLLPRTRMPLNIFEPRYRQMIVECMKTPARLIGIIQPDAARGEKVLYAVGCAGRLTQFNETDDGRYLVNLTGVARFRLVREITDDGPYLKASVCWDGFERDLGKTEIDEAFDRSAFLSLLDRYFRAKGLSTDWNALKTADQEVLINSLSILCPFEPVEKQALLEAPSLTIRRKTLAMLIESVLRGGNAEARLQ